MAVCIDNLKHSKPSLPSKTFQKQYIYILKNKDIKIILYQYIVNTREIMNVEEMKQKLDKIRERNTCAIRKYRTKNRARINAISKKYYDKHKNDPVWLAAKRDKQRIYTQLCKDRKNKSKEIQTEATLSDKT